MEFLLTMIEKAVAGCWFVELRFRGNLNLLCLNKQLLVAGL